ncbi:MAG: hypothetical protein H6561_22630 [Lewinellaceae bacterium]|nr:hypothetical protein [Lewinellaceae bacterium]
MEIARNLVKKDQASSVVVHLKDGSIAAHGL